MTIEALNMKWCRPESTHIDRGTIKQQQQQQQQQQILAMDYVLDSLDFVTYLLTDFIQLI